jgi:hypothetical protein
MMIDERSRHALYLRLEEVLGAEEAETLMEHLPPVGWADVATTRDLDGLRSDFNAQRVSMKQDMELLRLELRGEMTRGFATMTRTYVITSFGSAIAVASLVLAAVRL